jgi:hypothetical protein
MRRTTTGGSFLATKSSSLLQINNQKLNEDDLRAVRSGIQINQVAVCSCRQRSLSYFSLAANQQL